MESKQRILLRIYHEYIEKYICQIWKCKKRVGDEEQRKNINFFSWGGKMILE